MTNFFVGVLVGMSLMHISTYFGEQKYSDKIKECIKEERPMVKQYDILMRDTAQNTVIGQVLSTRPNEVCTFIMKNEHNEIKAYRIQCVEGLG